MFEVPRPIQPAIAGNANVAVDIPPDSGIDLQRILSVLWRGKAIILSAVAASLLIAVAFVLIVPHRYTAVTQILIDPTDLHAVGNELTPTNQANDATVLLVESQVRVLTSDSVLRRVVKTEGLDKDPEFAGQAAAEGIDASTAALNALKRKVGVKRAERTYVVDVSVTTREAAKSARIANAIAQAYLQEQTDVRSDAARQISQSLSSRLTELKDRVRAAEDRVEAFKARNNILGASGQLVNEQQLTEMNNQLTASRARTAAARARLDQVQQLQLSKNEPGAFPEAIQSQTITALRSQYAEVMRREAEQMTSLGARHPAVIEIRAEAERLRHMIDDEVRRIALSARTEYEGARANEEMLAANLEKLKSNAVTTNEAMVTLRELDRDVQANRAVYEAFLVRARETGEQERLDTKNIRVISPAAAPLYRSYPPSNALLALGAVLFGVLGGDRPIDDLLVAEGAAVGGHAPFEALLTAEREELDKALFDVRLAAGEFDVEVPDKVLQIKQRLLPVLDGHFVAVMRTAPIFAVAALVIATFDHFPIDRHRHGDIAAGSQIDLFCYGVADVMRAETCQFQNVHSSPREDLKTPCHLLSWSHTVR